VERHPLIVVGGAFEIGARKPQARAVARHAHIPFGVDRVPALVVCIAFPSTFFSNPRAGLHASACKPLELCAPASSDRRAALVRIVQGRQFKTRARLNYAI
jgi:hypothetical protein